MSMSQKYPHIRDTNLVNLHDCHHWLFLGTMYAQKLYYKTLQAAGFKVFSRMAEQHGQVVMNVTKEA